MRYRPSFLAVGLVALAVLLPSVASAQGRAFEPADWYRLTTLSSPALSPDGSQVAFTVTTVDEANNRRHSEVWLVGADGDGLRRLTSPGTESSNPRWSPDGTMLYFSSQRPGGSGGTWALYMDGRGGEAFQPDDVPSGAMPADGSFVVTTRPADDGAAGGGPQARSGGSDSSDPYRAMPSTARPPWGSITVPVNPARFDGRHIVDTGYKRNGAGYVANAREERQIRPTQIFTAPASDPDNRRQLTDTDYSHRSATVSPDGRWIAYTAHPEGRSDAELAQERDSLSVLPYLESRDEAPRNDSDIFVMPATGGEARRLTDANGSEGRMLWSPDSRSIAYVSSPERTASNRLWIVDVEGNSEPRNLLGDWQYEPASVEWTDDGYLLMTASVGGRTALFHVDPAGGGEPTEVIGGRRRINGFSYDEGYDRVAFVATSVHEPTELFIANIDGSDERRLTGFNDELNAEIDWPEAERFTYESVGGLEIEAWLQYPHGYTPGQRYPLVLYIHGGPHSAYGEGWFDEFHNITGAGMFVLYTNPRGSSGYGADFTYSTRGRWGLEDYEDIMKAVDIVAERDDVDENRMGVTGGSYGGFMTAWITTRTDRFKAAQADRMISNWVSWYGMSDAQSLTEFEFYGKPWDNLELYEQLSPIRFVENVTTPTLIVQSEEDHRTPMGDAEQWFMSLRKQGVPVEFMRYPRSTHDLSRTGEPWLLVDRLGRLRQWFEHWLSEDMNVTDGS